MFGGLTHEPAVRLASRLVELTPRGLDHVFFVDSGSVAVEVAIKMALQYWRARGRRHVTACSRFEVAITATRSVRWQCVTRSAGCTRCSAESLPRTCSRPRLRPGLTWRLTMVCRSLTDTVERHAGELAAVIVEPVVQGAGGMHFYWPEVVALLRALCDRHGLLLILDEIATGFGRTGQLFASDHAHVAPDVMCVGKALTGGYLSLAATLCTADVAATISGGREAR